jgi:hypothetical protein
MLHPFASSGATCHLHNCDEKNVDGFGMLVVACLSTLRRLGCPPLHISYVCTVMCIGVPILCCNRKLQNKNINELSQSGRIRIT